MTKITQIFRNHNVEYDEEIENFHLELKNQLKINDIFTKNINVSISNTTEESFFIFFKKQFFKINTEELGWTAMRTFDDFLVLRKYFLLSFPFITIPEVDLN